MIGTFSRCRETPDTAFCGTMNGASFRCLQRLTLACQAEKVVVLCLALWGHLLLYRDFVLLSCPNWVRHRFAPFGIVGKTTFQIAC
jgi:hypothetical protein